MNPMREVYTPARKKTARKLVYACLLITATLFSSVVQAQLKVGDNPTKINKSSVLELESTNQGFLLPRIADTTLINALTPPDGTMIYFADASATPKPGIYIRRTVGVPGWYRLVYSSEDKGWTMDGNQVDPSLFPKALIGATNDRSLNFITRNLVRMTIDSASGKVNIIDSLVVSGPLVVSGVATLDSQLVVADTASFAKLVKAGTNLVVSDTLISKVAKFSDSLYLTNLKGLSLLTTVLVHDTVTGTVERRTVPADVFKGWTIGDVDTSAYATALERIIGQQQDRDTLIIHGATLTTSGVVSTTTQSIAGTKIIRDSLLVGNLMEGVTVLSPNSTLQVAGSVAMNIEKVSTSITLGENNYTVIADGGVTITLPDPTVAKGRIYIIKGAASASTANPVKIIGTVDNAVKDATDPLYIYNAGSVHKLQSDGATSWYLIK
jgi:hypothetical protein